MSRRKVDFFHLFTFKKILLIIAKNLDFLRVLVYYMSVGGGKWLEMPQSGGYVDNFVENTFPEEKHCGKAGEDECSWVNITTP